MSAKCIVFQQLLLHILCTSTKRHQRQLCSQHHNNDANACSSQHWWLLPAPVLVVKPHQPTGCRQYPCNPAHDGARKAAWIPCPPPLLCPHLAVVPVGAGKEQSKRPSLTFLSTDTWWRTSTLPITTNGIQSLSHCLQDYIYKTPYIAPLRIKLDPSHFNRLCEYWNQNECNITNSTTCDAKSHNEWRHSSFEAEPLLQSSTSTIVSAVI